MAIAAGGYQTVALKADGSTVAWGNGSGSTPVPLAAQSGVRAIAAGDAHTLALKNDGSIVAWGYNGYGETDVPAGLSGVTAIAGGFGFTVALIDGVALIGTGPVMPVSLNAGSSGNGLVLSWPTNAVGFTLQSTANLSPPVTWIDSRTTPVVMGAQFALTNPVSGTARFYRLIKR
jgi:hypothetical protein